MPSPPANAPSPSDPAALPPQHLRTAISLALFIYLFTLAVGVIARDVSESPLEQTLGQVQGLRHLRQLLWIDDSYDYYLTHAEAIDVDHSITADVSMPDGSTETVVLPDAAIRSPLARRRWQLLAYRLALFSTIPDLEPARDIVMQALAARILAETGGKSVVIHVRGHNTPPEMGRYDPRDEKVWQNYRDVYAARAWISGGRVNLLKQESKVDAAPAARSP